MQHILMQNVLVGIKLCTVNICNDFLNWCFHADRTLKLRNMYQWDFATFTGCEYFADGQYSPVQTQKGRKIHILYVDSHIVQGQRHRVKTHPDSYPSSLSVLLKQWRNIISYARWNFLVSYQGRIISKWTLEILSV